MHENRQFIAIDLKSFYASVECVKRGLDPLLTNLVVADAERTEKTICLAVSPSLKAMGIKGRPRLFEVVQKVKEINNERKWKSPAHKLEGESFRIYDLKKDPTLALGYITATPSMSSYMKVSAQIYQIYLKYIAPEDIHVYSIDEVFIDATSYLKAYGLTAKQLASKMILDVYEHTGIPAAAGIGTNLYLCKVAMDIVAKHVEPDENDVRIAELDEFSYRQSLWTHKPLIDFWRVGRGYVRKLEEHGMYTMGDIARASLTHEDLFYNLFGINAELLIDHAWGYESCTIADIKAYKPSAKSIGSGQVLQSPYTFEKARIIVQEMIDALVLDLVDKELVTNQIILTIGYDVDNLNIPEISFHYHGPVTTDYYGRKIPKHAHGSANIEKHTSSNKLIMKKTLDLYDRIVDQHLLIRRINLAANRVVNEVEAKKQSQSYEQFDLFTDYEVVDKIQAEETTALEKEKNIQKTVLDIKKKYGKNAVLKGTNLKEGATAILRNKQIGGHKS